jgi:hypothetical protein
LRFTKIELKDTQNILDNFNIEVIKNQNILEVNRYFSHNNEQASNVIIDLNNIENSINTENAMIVMAFDNNGLEIKQYNRDQETFSAKSNIDTIRSMHGHHSYGILFKKFKDEPITEFCINVSEKSKFKTNISNIIELEELNNPFEKVLVRIESNDNFIKKDSIKELTVQLVDRLTGNNILKDGVFIYLKTDKGMLSHNKVETSFNGCASFKINSDMLSSNENITLKAGFRYFSNIDSKKIKVI